MEAKQSEAGSSFWASLQGLFVAGTGLIVAVTTLATTVYPMFQAIRDGAEVLSLTEFSMRTVLEGGKYKVRSGADLLLVSVDDIKVGQRVVHLSIGLAGNPGGGVQIIPGQQTTVVVGAKQYVLTLHDLADVVVGADTARISLAEF